MKSQKKDKDASEKEDDEKAKQRKKDEAMLFDGKKPSEKDDKMDVDEKDADPNEQTAEAAKA